MADPGDTAAATDPDPAAGAATMAPGAYGAAPCRAPMPPPGGADWDRDFWVTAGDGVRLRAALWNASGPRGHVVFLTGRTEFLEKVAIPATALAARGFAVASLDWRGQGLSDRLLADPWRGHVDRFESYHGDLTAFLAAPELAGLAGPRLVVAHSMGGAIAAGARQRGLLPADAMVLSAPMFEIRLSPLARVAARAAVALARGLGRPGLCPPSPNAERPYVLEGFDGNLLTSDREVFEWIAAALRAEPRLATGGAPTLGWIGAAFDEMARIASGPRLGLPALCLLGSEEAVVDPAAVERIARRLGAEMAPIDGARHEVLIEARPQRAASMEAIDAFLVRTGL